MITINKIRNKLFSFNVNQEIDLMRKTYHFGSVKEKVKPMAIACLDGRTVTSGFADRLRGMITIYAYAQQMKIPFRIEHIEPFKLQDYFVPNKYDWLLKEGEKSLNLFYANPIFLRQTSFCHCKGKRLLWVKKKRQHHFYTNANYLGIINKKYHTDYQFGNLFQELFKPSPLLQEYVDKYGQELGNEYISVSFRFMQLMGDFKDCYGDVLNEEDKKILIKKSLKVIEDLHNHNNKKVLVTSDSQSFIDEAKKLNFVYVIPGEIGHIGFSKGTDVYMKTFLDFYMISQASHVYMAHSGKMYRSNFAPTAAKSNNVPYDEIVY